MEGGEALPDVRANDCLLTSLASGNSEGSEQGLIAIGAWRADMWRASEVFGLGGEAVGKWLRTFDGVTKKWLSLVHIQGLFHFVWFHCLAMKFPLSLCITFTMLTHINTCSIPHSRSICF